MKRRTLRIGVFTAREVSRAELPPEFLALLDEPAAEGRKRVPVCIYDEGADRLEPVGLTPEALREVAESYVGLPVLCAKHANEADPGQVEGKVLASAVLGQRIVQVHEYWTAQAVTEVTEVRQGYSAHWRETNRTKLICSRCNERLTRNHVHQPGVAGCRALYTSALAVEVTRTYAPIVADTGVLREALRALLQEPGEPMAKPVLTAVPAPASILLSWESIEGATYAVVWGETLGALVERIEGATSPHTHEGLDPGKAYSYQLEAITAAETLKSDVVTASPMPADAEEGAEPSAMREVKALRARVAQMERTQAKDKTTATLRALRNLGFLNGKLPAMAQDAEKQGVDVQKLGAFLRKYGAAGEVRVPGVQFSNGEDAPDEPEAQLETPAELEAGARRRATANKTTYTDEYRALRRERDANVKRRGGW